MGRINVLSFSVANLIAAGEVVDRPSSVIKELLENAIDAGADKITVEIQRGGIAFMRVTDNGCGISPDDLPVAIRRHATSKIKEAEDLDSILTLGFRGEALAAIAAVSHLRILTRTADAEMGSLLEAEAGNVVRVTEQGCAKGTTVIVEELFANVPARRKFLKKDSAETMAVCAIVERVALSRPDIAFTLITDGSRRFDTAGDGKLENTIHAVFGRDFARRMIPVEISMGGIEVKGYIGRSDNVKPNRNYQNFFINGRYVKSKTAAAAIEQAYTSFIAPERYPVCVLCITLHPGAVDVNVHPAKLEVKFSNEKVVFEAIYHAVRGALARNSARPELVLEESARQPAPPRSFLPLEDRVPGQKTVPRQMTIDTVRPVPTASAETVIPPHERMAAMPAQSGGRKISTVPASGARAGGGFASMSADEYRAALSLPPRPSTTASKPAAAPTEKAPPTSPAPTAREAAPVLTPPASTPRDTAPAPAIPSAPHPTPALLPSYRIIGEAFNCYILVERGDTLLLIDKHAAHERILFEEFKEKLKQVEGAAQLLIPSLEMIVSTEEGGALEDYRTELEEIGFNYILHGTKVEITQIPNGLSLSAAPDLLGLIAAQILTDRGDARLTRDLLFERALYQASCKSAIKAGRVYAEAHIEWLVEKLLSLPDITVCPHGRPVAIELSHRALDKQFSRE